MTFIDFCVNKAMHARMINSQEAISDACLMVVERVETMITEVRRKKDAEEWRAACDEILAGIKKDLKGEG